MRSYKKTVLFFLYFSSLLSVAVLQYINYECPGGWEDFDQFCYKFTGYPTHTRDPAKEACAGDGAYLLSVNSDGEHQFVSQQLQQNYDNTQEKRDWWTSGRRMSRDGNDSLEFYWEGDGKKIESHFYWQDDDIITDAPALHDYILYNHDGQKWGWILGTQAMSLPTICKISKEDIYKITEEERGPDYGVENADAETLERGCSFTIQPEDTIHELTDINGYASIECEADAYPPAEYDWFHRRAGQTVPIDPVQDDRYTMINGKVIIHEPSSETNDDGNYHCETYNKFGRILSNEVSLSFGYLQDFPKSPRSEVMAIAYQWVSIECSPPDHYPSVLYTWYKNDIYNFIRPDLKPYIKISNDGRLYFSEVTSDDIGQYYCLVYKPGQDLTEGKVSMPTFLNVIEASPGVYEPEIGGGFPRVYPSNPKVGDDVRLECWASGTSNPEPMYYWWERLESFDSEKTVPFPVQVVFSDHNRDVLIGDINMYDAGTYRCNVRRPNGQLASGKMMLSLNSHPYFIVPLSDKYIDVGTDLVWTCDAGGSGNIAYIWYKNGGVFNESTIPSADRDRITFESNVITIRNVDGESDDGMYQCVSYNDLATRYSSAELRVLSFAPNFNKYPLQPNQLATVDGNTTLFCRPEAAPYPHIDDINWYRNNAPVIPDSRIQKLPNGNLFISPARKQDSGTYRCHVVNSLGEASTTGNLTILDTTTITLHPIDTTVSVNNTAFLHCMASYNPMLDITYVWHHGDMLIEFEKIFRLGENRYEVWTNPHYMRGQGIYMGGLYIMNAQHANHGRYTCAVESSSGKISTNSMIQVIGPPSEPAGVFIDTTTITSSSVMIQWKAGGTNGREILAFVVEAINYWEGFWRFILTNVRVEPDAGDTYRLNITSLHPWSQYQIRLRAENVLGTSVPSVPSEEFTTNNIPPQKVPEEVGGGGGKVGDLTITWKALHPWEHNGAGIGYIVYWKEFGDEMWDDFATVDGNVGRHVVLVGSGNYYRQYQVAVKAFNDAGEGPISDMVTIRSAMDLPAVIAQNVRAQPFNATACLVHWEPVEDNREYLKGKLGGYRLSYWMECCEDEENAPRVTIDGQAEEGLVIGLYPDTSYFFDVMVWNDAGNGPKSQYFIQRTLRQAPINPPVEVDVQREGPTSISLKWRGVSTAQEEEPLEGYKVRIWNAGEDIKVATDYDSGKDVELYIDDLRPDIMYKLRVFGYSRGGDGTQSSPAIKFEIGAGTMARVSFLTLTIGVALSLLHRLL